MFSLFRAFLVNESMAQTGQDLMPQNKLLINLEKVTFSYPGGPPVLDALDFKFYEGCRLGLIAPNGSGKTTLFHIIMGL